MSAANKPCILLVEDDHGMRRSIERNLQQAGYDIVACENFFDASDWLDAGNRPDLLLTDFNYPGELDEKGGLDTAKKMKALFGDSVPRILMSALATSVVGADRELFVAVLEKPVKTDALLAMVKSKLVPSINDAPSIEPDETEGDRKTALDKRSSNSAVPSKTLTA